MKRYLILASGSPATGKSYLIEQIKQKFSDMFILTPDECKEIFADSIGFNSLEEKAELEKKVWKFYYGVLDLYMGAGKRVILSDYPFSDKQKPRLSALSEKYGYEVITIRLDAAFEILWERRKRRDIENTRHLSHIMTHYHFGDELPDRSLADALITKEEFKEIVERRKYNQFQLGSLYEVEVSDYSKVDYSELVEKLYRRIHGNS